MSLQKYVGKEAIHPDHGRVLVTGAPKKARTTLYFRVVQRRPGWNEATEEYRPVKEVRLNPDAGPGAKTLTWRTYNRDEYGFEDECHVNQLTFQE